MIFNLTTFSKKKKNTVRLPKKPEPVEEYSICVAGSSCGKSCLTIRFAYDRFDETNDPTLGTFFDFYLIIFFWLLFFRFFVFCFFVIYFSDFYFSCEIVEDNHKKESRIAGIKTILKILDTSGSDEYASFRQGVIKIKSVLFFK